MIEFGQTLRKARETKGLTHRQIADATHLMIQVVQDLENENFSKIVAPIYGRGFIKLYCEAVDIDPQPLIDEFMAIYTGNRQPTIHIPTPAPAHETPTPTEQSVANPPTTPEPPAPPPTELEPPPPAEPSAPPPVTETFKLEEQVIAQPKPFEDYSEPKKYIPPTPSPSRYAAPLPIEEPKPFFENVKISIPPTVWRVLALACGACLILWFLWFCVKSLYNATMRPSDPAPTAEVAQPQTAKPSTPSRENSSDSTTKRQPMKIPPLYIN